MKWLKRLVMTALVVATLGLLAGCDGNGWDALPADEHDQCFQIEEWHSSTWTKTTEAKGLYCKTEPSTPAPPSPPPSPTP